MKLTDAWATICLHECGSIVDDHIAGLEETAGQCTELRLMIADRGEDDGSEFLVVDGETGLLILEAAKKIIAERRAALGVEIEE